jgi:tetratricopeptide (TPR) repeat protein
MPFHCVVGGRRSEREAAARAHLSQSGSAIVPALPSAVHWPFTRAIVPDIASGVPAAILIADLHLAFPAGQTSGTRLVLTQSTYQLQRWLDRIGASQAGVVAHASKSALADVAPEAFTGRGPWSRITIEELPGEDETAVPPMTDSAPLHSVYSRPPGERLDILRGASADGGHANPALHLGVASTLMELDDLQPAQEALEQAIALAPDWEAVWFEYGKLWLRADDLERAAERFAEAARLMPTFSAALSNLGAALAETERPEEATAALEQALRSDPRGHPILNNLAVILREQGRLDEAIDAGRRVVALAPAFVFGYYNLAHALFLSGRFAEARDTYEDGHRRDPQKNAVQAARLAVARAASGEGVRAAAEMREVLARVPPEVRDRIAEEAAATLDALAPLAQVKVSDLEPLRDVIARAGE